MAELDAELGSLLIRKSMQKKEPGEAAWFVDPEILMPVSVQFSGDIESLRDTGFEPREVYGNIAYGAINVETLEKLAKLPSVISIQKQRKRFIQLDDSVPDIRADDVWSRAGDNFSGYTGHEVIVGIIDTGIDFRHINFINPDGTTRILQIWDQTINPPAAGENSPAAITTGPFTAGLGYGVEYTEGQINDTLNNAAPAVPVRHVDENGHGTHVAGIAAGSGRQAGGCHGEYHYIGVAPGADLVIVRLSGLTTGDAPITGDPPTLEDALRYIFNIGLNLDRPVAINCSLGAFTEFMNGNSAISQHVDDLLNNNTLGRQVVWAAGNDGDSDFHATGTVPAGGTLELNFKIYGSDTENRSLVILYSGANLEVQVTSPIGGANGTVPWVSAPDFDISSTANGATGYVTVENQADRISINLVPPAGGNNVANTLTNNWKIELRDTTATDTDFDALCLYGSSHDRKSPKFLNHTTSNSTLTQEATTAESISVGSYKVGGKLAKSSGRGPTLDGDQKPDICAPGVDITSAGIAKDRAGDLANCCCECCQDWYVGMSGTSMAAPHVTGAIALMLHKNPLLPHTQIKDLLMDNAGNVPNGTSPEDLVGWGDGPTDAFESVDHAHQINPPIPMVADPADLHAPLSEQITRADPDQIPAEADPAGLLPPLLEQFLSTDYGQIYFELAQKYFREIYDLINTNKRVATSWHRNKGPVWTRIAINAFFNHDFKIPLTAGGLRFSESVEGFLVMLKRYASPELLSDLERCEPHIHLLKEGMTLPELMFVLGNQPLPLQEPVSVGA
jgi:subtilisin family serine protease